MKCLKSCGYKRTFKSNEQIVYENKEASTTYIDIKIDQKRVYIGFEELFKNIYNNYIDFRTLKAINTKVKELGWEE